MNRPAVDPHLIVCVGLHGSASTWVFNVVRELVAVRYGYQNVEAGFYENGPIDVGEGARRGRCQVLKTHRIGSELEKLVTNPAVSVILSIRDPRDALVSIMQRFSHSFDVACEVISRDCRSARLAANVALVLRYEEDFFSGAAGVHCIADHLGISVTDQQITDLVSKYDIETVRAFALMVRKNWEIQSANTRTQVAVDPLTQIHANHIGDGKVGKWRTVLNREDANLAERRLGEFAHWFGYES